MKFNPTFLLIATARYNQYVNQCVEGIKRYFPKSKIYLFGDGENADFKIEHQPFPYITLYRFHYFNQAKDKLIGDYFYFMDIDSSFVSQPDIQGDLVGTRHCAYYFDNREIPNEDNKRSVFYNYKFTKYYGGGFFGGNRDEFFKLCDWCEAGIDKDIANHVIPKHNDETAMNAYFSIHPPTREMTPDYHFPENWQYFSERCWGGKKPFTPTILLLDKFKKESEREYRATT